MKNPTPLGLLISAALVKVGAVCRDGKTLSTYRAAKLTGVDARDIGRIISGQVSPSISTLERLFAPVGWEVEVSFFPRKK
jgi:transcriptional regulator with XRE-family HTH domain